MKNAYLLPCPCGRTVPIFPQQAGETVQCQCGATIVAPTMLQITALERSESESIPVSPKKAWGLAERLLLVGVIVMLISAIGGGFVLAKRPVSPAEVIRAPVERFSPAQSVQFFRFLENQGLYPMLLPPEKEYLREMARYRLGIGILTVLGSIGLAMIAGAIWSIAASRGNGVPKVHESQ